MHDLKPSKVSMWDVQWLTRLISKPSAETFDIIENCFDSTLRAGNREYVRFFLGLCAARSYYVKVFNDLTVARHQLLTTLWVCLAFEKVKSAHHDFMVYRQLIAKYSGLTTEEIVKLLDGEQEKGASDRRQAIFRRFKEAAECGQEDEDDEDEY